MDSTGKTTFDAVLYELALRRLPRWLELQMRNSQPATFNNLKEAVARYLGNQRREGDGRETEQKECFRPTPQHTHNKSKPAEQKQFYSEKGNNWKTEERKHVECFRCGRKSHIKRDCRVKLEEANFVRDQEVDETS